MTRYGETSLVDIPTPASYTPLRGLVRSVSKRCLAAEVDAYTATLAALGYSWEASPENGTPYTIVTTVAAPEPTTTWELDGNDVEVSIFGSDKVKEAFLSLGGGIDGAAARADFRSRIEALVRGDYPTAGASASRTTASAALQSITNDFIAAVSGAGTGQSIPEPFTSWDEFFSELVTDMISGAEAAPIKAFVLRRRSILPPLTNVSPGFDGAGEVYSTQSLLTAEPTIPVNFRDAMPPGWWAKKTPTATQNTDGTWAYVVEYWWAKEASRIIYDRNE